jgi:leucyl/phenylalanyl-tRNA---protein transferase
LREARLIQHPERVVPWLDPDDPFPPVENALKSPNGLLAAGADLSPERLLDAYSRGIFPWFSEEDPLLWWSPDPRMVLFVNEFHASRSLRRVLKSGRFQVTLDTAFAEVMEGCAEPRADDTGTWITGEMHAAYNRLAELGFAHSVEVWEDADLVGGLYGVAVGRMFFGESMFSRRTDASKVALATLARQLAHWGFPLVDCQMSTNHLASLGAREVPRAEFVRQVRSLVAAPPVPSPWRLN